MAPLTSPESSNGARSNLFLEPDEPELDASSPRTSSARRGRGLVVALDDSDSSDAGGASSGPNVARFTRAPSGLGGLPAAAQQRATRADRDAQRLLERIGRQRYGALIAVVVVAALLLAVSWLGLSLRAASADRVGGRDQQATATRALTDARIQARAVNGERDRARRAAAIARGKQARAETSATRWHARADRLERQATRATKSKRRAKSRR